MDNYYKMYWLTRLNPIMSLFHTVLTITVSFLIIYYMVMGFIFLFEMLDKDEIKESRKSWRVCRVFVWIFLFISILGITFVPTRNEMIVIIAGGKTIDYIQKDTSLSKIPYQATTIVSSYMDNMIKDLKEPEKKETKK